MDKPKWQKTLLRNVFVAVAVVAVGLAVASLVLLQDHRSNAADQREMERVVNAIAAESAAVTTEYLAAPESAVGVVASVYNDVALSEDMRRRLFIGLIDSHDQIDAVFVGYPNGDFSFFARALETEGIYRSREISTSPTRRVAEAWYDSDQREIRSAFNDESDYDPRSRPWYGRVASGAQDQSWTDPYVFSSSNEIGVTFSRGIRNEAGEIEAVIGVDVTLDELVSFMARRRPSADGTVAVLNERGDLLASSEIDVDDLRPDDWALPAASVHAVEQVQHLQATGVNAERAVSTYRNDGQFGQVVPVGGTSSWYLAVEAAQHNFIESPASPRSVRVIATFLLATLAAAIVAHVIRSRIIRSKELHIAANIDQMTKLTNRAGVLSHLRELQSTVSSTQDIVVAVVDVDRFKSVNDTWGHDVGDDALREVARRIAGSAQSRDLHTGRLGGDEFIVYGAVAAGTSLDDVWAAIASRVASIDNLNGLPIDIGASVGVAQSQDNATIGLPELLKRADTALYQAKALGGGVAEHVDATAGLPHQRSAR